MITIDKQLEGFLFPHIANNERPQRVFALQTKKAIMWFPGKNETDIEKVKKALNTGHLTGYTGKIYSKMAGTMVDEHKVAFFGIDIDDYTDYEKIKKELPNYSIRYSNSKTGLHLIKRVVPIYVPANVSTTEAVKVAMQDDIDKLACMGVPVCCYGNNAFYFASHGWLYQSDIVEAVEIDFTVCRRHKKCNNSWIKYEVLEDDIKNLVDILIKNDIIEMKNDEVQCECSIWIKELYEVLKGTQYEFQTSSPMKSTMWEINGMIKITPSIVNFYTHASKCWSTIWASF